ncbi:MAG: diguanylate cyclase (GGDEF)-like protein, partial [Oleiphilaceae bacterium]
ACIDSLPEQDMFGRLGGEEFAIVLPETNVDDGQEIAERIRKTVADLKNNTVSAKFGVTLSIVIAQLSLKDKVVKNQAQCVNTLFQKADFALYQSKEKGRNQITLA